MVRAKSKRKTGVAGLIADSVTESIETKPDTRHSQTQLTAKGSPLTKVECWMLPSATLAINTPVLSLTAMLLLDLRGNIEPPSAPAVAGLMSVHAWHFSEPLLLPATFIWAAVLQST